MPVSITIEALLLRRLANTSLPCLAMQPVINVSVFDRGGAGGDELPLQGHNYELMYDGTFCTLESGCGNSVLQGTCQARGPWREIDRD